MKLPLRVNFVDEAVPDTRDIVVPGGILPGVGDEQRAIVDVLEAERSKPGRRCSDR